VQQQGLDFVNRLRIVFQKMIEWKALDKGSKYMVIASTTVIFNGLIAFYFPAIRAVSVVVQFAAVFLLFYGMYVRVKEKGFR